MQFLNNSIEGLSFVELDQINFCDFLIEFSVSFVINIFIPYSKTLHFGILFCLFILVQMFSAWFISTNSGQTFSEEVNCYVFSIIKDITDFHLVNFFLDDKPQFPACIDSNVPTSLFLMNSRAWKLYCSSLEFWWSNLGACTPDK